jgi:hypothetical protein
LILPVFKNHIARKSEAEVWRDLFSKKLSLPSNEGKGFFDSLFVLRKVTYSDLVYNLYILYNRAQLLPLNAKRISFDPQTAHGLIELPSDDPLFKVERLYLLEKGLVYSLTLKTRMDIEAAVNFRNKILRETVFKNSTSDSAIPVYAHYKTIAYAHRVDQQGMAYLYSAWSHDLANKEYIRVIILFLERGKSNLKFLKPFYEYAYKRFGSNLSTENEFLLESADEKLKRKMKEELEVEVKKEAQTSGPKFEGNFSNPDEKINFYLKKAKDNKMNSDDDAKTLLQE